MNNSITRTAWTNNLIAPAGTYEATLTGYDITVQVDGVWYRAQATEGCKGQVDIELVVAADGSATWTEGDEVSDPFAGMTLIDRD